jgi:glycosyltransferase involved in cell wall biosynthesis
MVPFVSFVIPTYNRAEHIAGAVSSALGQSVPEIEVVVVDDGSTDETAKVVRGFDDPRVRYVAKENGERGAARNFGVSLARGEYVYFLDSDDVVAPNHVAHARSLLEAHGRPEVMHSRYQRVNPPGGREPRIQFSTCPDTPAAVLRQLLKRNVVGCYFFVRRDIALLHPFIEDRRFNVGEDWYVALVLASRYPMYVTQLTTRSVVSHPGQTMRQVEPERFLLAAECLSNALAKDAHFMSRHSSALPDIRAEMISLAALQYAVSGHRLKAMTTLVGAARTAPRAIVGRRTLATFKHALGFHLS